MTEATLYQPPGLSRTALTIVILMHGAALTALALAKTDIITKFRDPPTVVELLDETKPPPEVKPEIVEPRVPRPPQPSYIDVTPPEVVIPRETQVVATGPVERAIDPIPRHAVTPTPEPTITPEPRKVEPARARANLASYVSDSDYPAAAIRGEEQGTTRFKLGVAPNGKVTDCSVVKSSGSSSLDMATCRLMKSRAKFSPARNSDGQPVGDSVTSAIRWVLPE